MSFFGLLKEYKGVLGEIWMTQRQPDFKKTHSSMCKLYLGKAHPRVGWLMAAAPPRAQQFHCSGCLLSIAVLISMSLRRCFVSLVSFRNFPRLITFSVFRASSMQCFNLEEIMYISGGPGSHSQVSETLIQYSDKLFTKNFFPKILLD